MKRNLIALSFLTLAAASGLSAQGVGDNLQTTPTAPPKRVVNSVLSSAVVVPDADNAGLKLPAGFGALKVAEGLGRARHIAVTAQNDIYVKMNGKIAEGKGILKLRDRNADGRSDETTGIGNSYWGCLW